MTAAAATEIHRDDGPVARRARPRVPVPPLVLAALVVVGTAALVAAAGRTSPWVVGATGTVTLLVALCRPSSGARAATAWTVPPALRLLEYATAVGLGASVDPTAGAAAAFAYVLAVGYHHYDVVYRVRHQGDGPAGWVADALGGWELRTLLLVVAWALGLTIPALLVVAVWSGAVGVGESVRFWVHVAGAAGPGDAGDEEVVV